MSKIVSQKKRVFGLPMTAVFVCGKREDGKFVAHSLDFDLVAVGADKDKAFQKLRLAVKTYVEYGLSNNWVEDIPFSAPDEFWDAFSASTSIGTAPPIEIEDDRMIVVHATMSNHEHRLAACPA